MRVAPRSEPTGILRRAAAWLVPFVLFALAASSQAVPRTSPILDGRSAAGSADGVAFTPVANSSRPDDAAIATRSRGLPELTSTDPEDTPWWRRGGTAEAYCLDSGVRPNASDPLRRRSAKTEPNSARAPPVRRAA
jgi:hypothetical protein